MGDKAMTYSNGKMKRAGDTDTVDFDGHVNLGNADTDNIIFQGDVASNILPNATETYDLGSSSKMWRKGYFQSIIQRDVKVAKYASSGTQQRFIRFNTVGVTDATTANHNNFFIAPADGELLSIQIRTTSAANSTDIKFHKEVDGQPTSYPFSWSATDTENVNIANANTTYTANFTNSSFTKGQVLGISVTPNSAPSDVNITAVFIFDWNA